MTLEISPIGTSGLKGVKLFPHSDERGSLIRVFDHLGVNDDFLLLQSSFVTNKSAKIIRGLHFQEGINSESKIVLCLSGCIFDVVVNFQPALSPEIFEVMLGEEQEFQGLFIPAGWAHGYQTLSEESSLLYFMDKPYDANSQRGVRWDDPQLGIRWPFPPATVSERDRKFPLLGHK